MNKKLPLLLLATSTLLLTGCPKAKRDPYVYPDDNDEIVFDYSNNPKLADDLGHLYLVDGGEMTRKELTEFLNVAMQNDLYATKVTREYSKKALYMDATSSGMQVGDFSYKESFVITRNNETNSLSGTVHYDDEKWEASPLSSSSEPYHTNVSTDGTYSLIPNVETEIGEEKIDCEDDRYDSTNKVGYSEKNWLNKMNLTQSSDAAKHFEDILLETDEANEKLKASEKFVTSIISNISPSGTQVKLTSVSTTKTSSGNYFQVSYNASIRISGGMVVFTSYSYNEIEIDNEVEYLVASEEETRTLS